MTREEALELLKSCDTWECIPNKVINKTFDDHEAETTQLKERIAELEVELKERENELFETSNENADLLIELQKLKSGIVAEFEARTDNNQQISLVTAQGRIGANIDIGFKGRLISISGDECLPRNIDIIVTIREKKQ